MCDAQPAPAGCWPASGWSQGTWSVRRAGLHLGGLVPSPATCLQTADQLLARADAAKALAEEAAKKGRNTLQEANDILNNLKGTTGSGDGVKRLLPPQGRVPAFFSFLFSRDSLNIHRMKDNIVVPPCPWGILSRTPSGHLKSCIVPNPRYALLFPVPTCDEVNL